MLLDSFSNNKFMWLFMRKILILWPWRSEDLKIEGKKYWEHSKLRFIVEELHAEQIWRLLVKIKRYEL